MMTTPHLGAQGVHPVVASAAADDPANSGIRREPELPEHEDIVPPPRDPAREFELADEEPDDEAQRLREVQRQMRTVARQASLDPTDDLGL